MFKKILAVFVLSFVLVGCGDKTIDASTKQTYEQSVKEMAESLNDEQKAAFAGSLMTISFQAFFEAKGDETKAFEITKSYIDGKTYTEIIEIANKQKK